MSDQIDQALEAHKFSPDGSIWAPESLQQIRDRLTLIDKTGCMCPESDHLNALHDLAHDDMPALLKVIEQVRKLHKPEVINCISCPIECEEHEGDCPDDKPVTVCAECWQIVELANDYYGEDSIDQALLWPCATARLAYTTEELEER